MSGTMSLKTFRSVLLLRYCALSVLLYSCPVEESAVAGSSRRLPFRSMIGVETSAIVDQVRKAVVHKFLSW